MEKAKQSEHERIAECARIMAAHERIMAEYQRVTAPARAEYERIMVQARQARREMTGAECARIKAQAWAEYERADAPALAEYWRARRASHTAQADCAER